MKLAPLLETLLGTLSLAPELLSQLMLKLNLTQDIVNLLTSIVDHHTLAIHYTFQLMEDTQRLVQIRELLRHQLLTPRLLLLILQPQSLLHGIKITGTRPDLKRPFLETTNILKLFLNSIVDLHTLDIHYTFQLMEDTQRSVQIRELLRHQMLIPRLHLLILQLQSLLHGIKITGTRPDLKRPSLETTNILNLSNNSIVDLQRTSSHHMFQPMMPILRFNLIREL
jgi:hypothetical protein